MWWGDIKTMNIWKEKPEEPKEIVCDDIGIEELNLSNRARNALKGAECNMVSDVIKRIEENTLKKIRNLGVTTETEIREKVSAYTGGDYVLQS